MRKSPKPKKRSSGLITVAAVLALAVVGTGVPSLSHLCRFRPAVASPDHQGRNKARPKVMASPGGDAASGKTPDRMVPGDGGEKIVSRERRRSMSTPGPVRAWCFRR